MERILEDFLNSVRAILTDTCYTINFGKEEVFTLTEVAVAIWGLKSGKVAGKGKILPEM